MTEHRYDTYGIKGLSLTEARPVVEQALQVELTERESSYYGGLYLRYRLTTGREVKLYSNYDGSRDMWVREEYRPFSVVLVISDLDAMDEIRVRLQKALDAVVLTQKTFTDSEEADDEND